eukprot:3545721-Prymnesium_polylepis.1
MFTLPCCFTRLLSALLMHSLAQHKIQGNRDQCDIRFFVSQPNGPMQKPHCDEHYTRTQYVSEEDVLISGILAIEPGTKLVLYPDGPSAPSFTFHMEVGDLLLFR